MSRRDRLYLPPDCDLTGWLWTFPPQGCMASYTKWWDEFWLKHSWQRWIDFINWNCSAIYSFIFSLGFYSFIQTSLIGKFRSSVLGLVHWHPEFWIRAYVTLKTLFVICSKPEKETLCIWPLLSKCIISCLKCMNCLDILGKDTVEVLWATETATNFGCETQLMYQLTNMKAKNWNGYKWTQQT